MPFEVRLVGAAEQDLEEIDDWISSYDSLARANHVMDRLEEAIMALRRFPERGRHPPELLELGMREYRETFFKPYRIIYFIEGDVVMIVLVADGRRNMQALLARRLLGA